MKNFLNSLGGEKQTTASAFSVGDAVRARMRGVDELFDATVERVAPDGRLDVVFLDGDREFGLEPSDVRRKKKPAKAAASKGMGGMGGGAIKKRKKKSKSR